MAKRGKTARRPPIARAASAHKRAPRAVDLKKENAALKRELSESLEQQAATSDVLKVISRSTFELQAVLDTLTETAARLCAADMASISQQDEAGFYHVSNYNFPPDWLDYTRSIRMQPGRGSVVGRVLLEAKVVQVADVLADLEYTYMEPQKKSGYRTFLAAPLFREGNPIGVLSLCRKTVEPFTDKQIELVSTFADQAAIAIENVRLFDEGRARTKDLRESLQQQTATADVLKVISRSAFDLPKVLHTLTESACRLCDAFDAVIFLREGELLVLGAHYGPIPIDFPKWPLTRGWTAGRSVVDRKPVHVHDLQAELIEFPDGSAMARRMGHRTILSIPLLRGEEAIGSLQIRRSEINPFTAKQIELAETFADQAVIAIENVRLFDEVQARTRDLAESLEQQTATSEVLQVISSTPGELEPVFQKMLKNATRICEAKIGILFRYEDGEYSAVSTLGVTPAYADYLNRGPIRPGPTTGLGRVASTRQTIHIVDTQAEQAYADGEPLRLATAELGGARSLLNVPMLKEGTLIGAIGIFRQDVRPFTDKQIELVSNFAAQAVIAIENTRLLKELRQRTVDLGESLQQQTATSDVLQVISSSPGDLQPVFETMLENAVRICDAKFGKIRRWDGEVFYLVATHNAPSASANARGHSQLHPIPGTPVGRMVATKAVIHVADLAVDPGYIEQRSPSIVAAVELEGVRTILYVPILKETELIGAFTLSRQEVRPFNDKQVELVTNFASQAVIAIENTRLLNELRESLQQQTATADVLKVISRSTIDAKPDLEPVLETLLESAIRLCGATRGHVYRYDGEFLRFAASFGASPGFRDFLQANPIRLGRGSIAGRAALDLRVCHVHDVLAEENYEMRGLLAHQPFRSALGVPMLRDGALLGVIAILKSKVEPFTDKQIELVSTFADQAVIAIENVRLFEEVQARTRDLTDSLQQQTATADVLKVISRSTFDLQTVLQTLVESAAKLCDAEKATITRQKDGVLSRGEFYGFSDEFMEYVRNIPVVPDRGSATARALLEGVVVHIPDVQADPDYTFNEAQKLGDFRTIIGVPMLREGKAIGVIVMTRPEVRPFTEKQIELATTFADQAAIAIENVRLFENVEARTRELAASLEDLRSAQDRLVQTQKLASLGQLTAGIAHEIKNPLNFINNFSALSVELVDELDDALRPVTLDDKTREETDELTKMLKGNLERVVQHGKRADSIVKNMLLHSREGSGERRAVDLNSLVQESLNLAYHGARAENQGFKIRLDYNFDSTAGEVELFPQEITRVLLNLISNGFYAATKRKAEVRDGYEPALVAATRNLGDRVEISIRDNGVGIPPDVKDKMFNPFFTTKPPGEGTGLGLSLSYDIVVKQHAGSIEVDTRPGEFTEFKVILPRMAATSKAGADK